MIQKTEAEIMKNWKGDITNPVVSICSIAYNHEKYIEEALDSFLMQETDFPFEIVIDDDCSTDNTAKIINNYKKKFPTIINENIRKKNVGSINNFVSNMKRAKGQYIALCEGDDYWLDPLKLKKQVEFLDKNEKYILTHHNAIKVNVNNEVLQEDIDSSLFDLEQEELICSEKYIQTCTVMFRNIPLKYSKRLKKAFNGDAVLWHLLSLSGSNKYLKNVQPACYRVHNDGIWSKLKSSEKFSRTLYTKSLLLENLKGHNLSRRLENHLFEYIAMHLTDAIRELNFKKINYIIKIFYSEKHMNQFSFVIYYLKFVFNKLKFRKKEYI